MTEETPVTTESVVTPNTRPDSHETSSAASGGHVSHVGDASDLVIHVDHMGDECWACDVWVEGENVGGGTASTASGALDVAMNILYGDTNDHLNGDFGHITRLETVDAG